MVITRVIRIGLVTILSALLAACGGDGGSTGGSAVPPPVADSFAWTGNTRMTIVSTLGLLSNDPAGTVIAAADSTTSLGGTVTVDLSTGAFVYDPPVGLQNTEDTFSYSVAGTGSATVTISLAERVWYVRNNSPGANQGTLSNPFLTLAQAELAADADDTIFVFAGTLNDGGQNAGIILQDGQKLLGEGVGLTVNGVPIVSPFPNAVISNQAQGGGIAPVVLLEDTSGNEVAGFTIRADFNEGVLAMGGGGHDIHDNNIVCDAANGREGVRLLNVAGTNRIFDNVISGSPGAGIKVANNEDQAGIPVAATPVTGLLEISRNRVTSPQQDGIRIDLEGSGTDVALHLLTNTVTNPGTGAGHEGININSLGAANLSAVVSRNFITGSADEAMDLQVGGASSLISMIANNDLSAGAGATDFLGAVADGSTGTACLELMNNLNAANNATFSVMNNVTNGGTVELFDAGDNDTAVATSGTVTPVAQNSCGVVPSGSLLFNANCGICHVGNGLGAGNVGPNLTNATLAIIQLQLAINPTMSDISLTDQELQAISGALAAAP
jgi:mono/diheme cytochrome c family protein